MPADRHLATASGTAARGGSIMDISPTNRSPVNGKFSVSASNTYDDVYLHTNARSAKNSNSVGSVCNTSGQCA